MEGRLALPFHFAVEFLVLVVALGAAFDAVRARRAGAGRWALGQAAGFALLAAAQFLHGGQFAIAHADAAAEGGSLVVILRAAAFLVLAISARPDAAISAGLVAASAAPALFVPGPNARLAGLSAILALGVAARGMRAHRKDQDPGTFAFSAGFVAFAAAEAAVVFAPADGGAWLIGAHVARALGALLLARWLAASIARSIRMRFVAVLVLVLTIGVLVVSAALNAVISNNLTTEETGLLRAAGDGRATQIAQEYEVVEKNFASGLSTSLGVERRIEGVQPFDTAFLCQATVKIAPAVADFIMFTSADGKVLRSVDIRAHRKKATCPLNPPPGLSVDKHIAFTGSAVVAEAIHGNTSASTDRFTFAVGNAARPAIVVIAAAPVLSGNTVKGVAVVGTIIDAEFVQSVKLFTGDDASLVVAGSDVGNLKPTLIATTFTDANALVSGLTLHAGDLFTAQTRATDSSATLGVGGQDYLSVFVPLKRDDGRAVGLLVVSKNQQSLLAGQQKLTRTLFLITLAAVLLAALLAWWFAGRVTRPIRELTVAVRRLRAGDLEARARVTSGDEVGTLGTSFNEMASDLGRQTRQLSDANTTMEAILQGMGDGLIATDADGRVVTFNKAAEAMTRRTADRALGKKVTEVMHGTASDGRSLAEVAMAEDAIDGFLGTGTNAVAIAVTASSLVDDRGHTIGRVIVFRNVSREREAERMKSEFLSNVSHELRTPITPIKGYADIMRRKKVSRAKEEQFLEGIIQSTERLERIVEILVDFAAMEAGRLKPRAEPVRVQGLVDEVAAKWKQKDGRHRFVRRVPDRLPSVLGDSHMLARSLDELIDNAVKFSPDARVIEIIAEPYVNGSRSRTARKVAITVRDHGIGIEPEQVPDLFRDFRQLDGSETRSFGGLGLGLAYVKRIADAHGGDVLVESEPGRGSAFSLVLPAAEAHTKRAATGRVSAAARRESRRSK